MLLNSLLGLDLANAKVEPQGIDVLWDVPEVAQVARVRYGHGTRFEIAVCPMNVDAEDMEVVTTLVPQGGVPTLAAVPPDSLGCGHDDALSFAFWHMG